MAEPRAGPVSAASHVLIVGGGFAGLAAARALAKAAVRVTLVDRRNYHLFQPLLYQVATAALSPADIAGPIRHILSHQCNCESLLAEAERIDAPGSRLVLKGDEALAFDYLVVATGATHSYFGHDSWAPHAPGMCQGATQVVRHVGRVNREEVAALHNAGAALGRGGAAPGETGASASRVSSRRPFRYVNKGVIVTIGRASAVVDIRGVRLIVGDADQRPKRKESEPEATSTG